MEVVADEASQEASGVVAIGDVELVEKTTVEDQQEVAENCYLNVDTYCLLKSILSPTKAE